MEKEGERLKDRIKLVAEKFLEKSKDKEIYVISHFDTDGITSAAIMIKTLKKLDKKFSVKILKTLEEQFIYDLPKNKLILFLDLSSGSLDYIKKDTLEDVFIIDHHEIIQEVPENVNIINPELHEKQKISSSGLTYLFCKEIKSDIKELAKLAILGMIGDMLEKDINKLNNDIINDAEIKRKRGLLIYPSTRPLNRTLEFCSNPYIPGVTGNTKGVTELLREINLNPAGGKYKSLIELDKEEMERLITAIMLRNPKTKHREMIGDIFLLKFFNRLEDARELSAMINACSKLGDTGLAMQLCMEVPKAKKKAEAIHAKYKQFIISGLKFVSETEKIKGNGFVIINAKNNIKDTMVGTIASILSNSSMYDEGTTIITMAHYEDKIKISARNVGRNGRNVREILSKVITLVKGEVGGHRFAAGCTIKQDKEQEFIDTLKKNLEIELVKI
ncbi:MAG TPA: DHH family phosphoesterase [Candidatus Pacearchaeota archaeon]|nr:ssDNA exonuclease RecJ [archaeon BMS3Abin17]HDK42862.1 DHH family phosphoesterase [Candidatus Pacearchaeota archaeon]HDZ61112.1 DHH family phosphoesterase [Candidatus Pacearchaeota archaeon]